MRSNEVPFDITVLTRLSELHANASNSPFQLLSRRQDDPAVGANRAKRSLSSDCARLSGLLPINAPVFTDFRWVTFRLDESRPSVQVAFPTAKTEFLENGAVSMDRCNTGLEFTSGGFKAQSCSRALIQPSKPLAATFWLSHESTNRKQGLVRSLPARPASKFDPSAGE
jgi:hypothetical protein